MNARIQVEHGVTEELTGIDLVKRQIRIASGQKLNLEQRDIKINKHVIECRINAEDPGRNFAPSPGTISLYYQPGGPGVRVDSHVYSGYFVPPHYDSMVSKLIVTASTRDKAIDRMSRALSEYLVGGIKTSIPFCAAIMKDPAFRTGDVTTGYIKEFLDRTPRERWLPQDLKA